LQDDGYSVIAVADGKALNYLRDAPPPGLIILDLMMPVMDGWEFLEHQSRDSALLSIPVIVTTATLARQPLPSVGGSTETTPIPVFSSNN